MTKFNSGDKVKIEDKFTGDIREGEITGVFENIGDGNYYWVRFPEGGIVLYSDQDLLELNNSHGLPLKACECGASKLKHPSHSEWCQLHEF